jgi:hypothetical protein
MPDVVHAMFRALSLQLTMQAPFVHHMDLQILASEADEERARIWLGSLHAGAAIDTLIGVYSALTPSLKVSVHPNLRQLDADYVADSGKRTKVSVTLAVIKD